MKTHRKKNKNKSHQVTNWVTNISIFKSTAKLRPKPEENKQNIAINLIEKAIPLQAWTGREGSWRLRLPNFKTLGTRRW
jgi:hypothetical protein